MKKTLLLLSFCVTTLALKAQSDSWVQKNSLPGDGRGAPVAFAIGGKGYVGLGINFFVQGMSLDDFWEYNPANDSWTQKADYGGGKRGGAAGFVIDDMGYVMAGTDEDLAGQNDLWEFDPAANTWTQKADIPAEGRSFAAAFSIGDKGYVSAGNGDVTGPLDDLWEYDPAADTWTQKADFIGGARTSPVGFSINGIGYVGTGFAGGPQNDFYSYDPLTDNWTQKANVGTVKRSEAAAFVVNGYGYVCSGAKSNGLSHDLLRYDPLADSWTLMAELPGSGKSNAAGFGIDKGYVACGFDLVFSQTKDLYEYSPDSSIATFIEGIENEPLISVFPSLITDEATITVHSAYDLTNTVIEIYSSEGNKISADHLLTESDHGNEISFIFRRKNLSSGIYILVVRDYGGGESSHKLLLW